MVPRLLKRYREEVPKIMKEKFGVDLETEVAIISQPAPMGDQ